MEISSKRCKFENLQKMEIVHENADFSGKTDFGNTFCENGNSIKWKFEQEFSTQTFKNGIPFYRESAVASTQKSAVELVESTPVFF